MGGFAKISIAGIAVVTAMLALAACSTGFEPGGSDAPTNTVSSISPSNGTMQSHDGGGVTIDVAWLDLDGGHLAFSVAMNTHSVGLDGYDLRDLAVLRDDQGHEYDPVSWESGPGGHHRSGTLTFASPDSLHSGEAKSLELIIRDVAGIDERVMTWHLQ